MSDTPRTIIMIYAHDGGPSHWRAVPMGEIVCPVAGFCEEIRCHGIGLNHVGIFRLVRLPRNIVGIELDGLFRSGSLWRTKSGNRYLVGDRSLWRADELIRVL